MVVCLFSLFAKIILFVFCLPENMQDKGSDERGLDHTEKVAWQKLGYPALLPEFQAFQSRTNGPNFGKWYVSTTRGWGPNTCWMDKPIPFGKVLLKDGTLKEKSELKSWYKKTSEQDTNQYYFKSLEARIEALETDLKRVLDLQYTSYVPASSAQETIQEHLVPVTETEETMDHVNEPWPNQKTK